MIDTSTSRGKLIAAALALATERPWQEVQLSDIAERAGLPLDEVRRAAGSKSQILAHFMRAVDDEVLSAVRSRQQGSSKRDSLVDIIMSRLDILAPHKEALRSIRRAGATDTTLVMPFLNAQRWMLAAAGIETGLVRTLGLGSLYAAVFDTWLDDDDPGMARTMAALDRRLRRAETAVSSVSGLASGCDRIARDLGAVGSAIFSQIFSPRRQPRAPADDPQATTPPRA